MSVPELRWARVEPGASPAVLSHAEFERYATMVPARRDSFLAGRMLLRTLAAELTNTVPEAIELTAECPDCGGPHGKPVISGSPLKLSLTHAEGFVVAAASWGTSVGVDAEPARATPERLAAIGALAGRASLRHWTQVEAVLKADGRGLRVDPALVEIEGTSARLEGTGYDLNEFEVPGLTVSLAVAR